MLSQNLLGEAICLQLFPRAAYSGQDPTHCHTMGITLERQQGVHAIDSDRRVDFDTFAGVLAQTPIGIDVFSESAAGGEYLLLRLDERFARQHLPQLDLRMISTGHAQALRLAREMRRMLLAAQPDRFALEQGALAFVDRASSSVATTQRITSKAFIRVLDQMKELFHQPLSLEQLAATYEHNELRFLRDFTKAIGLTPHAYLIEVRLQAARQLIEHTHLPLARIALDVGFAHQSHMGTAFRQHLGMTPSEYRFR
jgi:AraC family transcriptional regulator